MLEEHASSYILSGQESSDFDIFEVRLATIMKFSRAATTVLDFGCGKGNFVKFLLTKGYKAFAYDKSERLKRYLVSQNISTYKNIQNIPSKYFDIVTCFDVIEHTTNPRRLVQTMKTKLKRGGILVISTPNSQGFSATILKSRWWVFGPAAHFILFSPYSLRILFTNMGYKVLHIQTDTLTPWFTPSERFSAKLLNKVVYLITYPFQKLLFNNYLGDNIFAVVRL